MANLTIRNVPEEVKQHFRVKAASDGHSLEQGLRLLLIENATDRTKLASNIDAGEILRRAAELEADKPLDGRFKHLTQKELSDAISGEFDGL